MDDPDDMLLTVPVGFTTSAEEDGGTLRRTDPVRGEDIGIESDAEGWDL